MQRRTRRLLLIVGTLGALVITAVVGGLSVPVMVEQPVLRIVLDTLVALTALLLGLLVHGRFLLHRRTSDLLLAGVLTIGFVVVPQVGDLTGRSATVPVWAPLVGGLLVATALAVAALWPRRGRNAMRRLGRLIVLGWLGAAALLVVAVWLVLPVLAGGGTQQAVIGVRSTAQQVMAVLALLSAGLYAAAAIGFARQPDDGPAPELAAAAVLLGFSRLDYALAPSLDENWVYARDLLRLLACLLLLDASVDEIRRYRREQARAAVQQERDRLAQTLHDGIAQEASLLATQTRCWPAGGRRCHWTSSPAWPSGRWTNRAPPSTRCRGRTTGRCTVRSCGSPTTCRAGGPCTSAPTSSRSVHCGATSRRRSCAAREATVNEARHGAAQAVDMLRTADTRVTVVVTDDGCGSDAARQCPVFGLQTISARLDAVGATPGLESHRGHGTSVLVQCS